MTLPSSSFQVSSISNPRTSRYQPRLFSRSLTVKLGDVEVSARELPRLTDFRGAAFARAGAFLFARPAVFFDLFAAIWSSRTKDAMTADALSQAARAVAARPALQRFQTGAGRSSPERGLGPVRATLSSPRWGRPSG